MEKVRKSFRISEDAAYDLQNIATSLGITETRAIEMALDIFIVSGVSRAIADLQAEGNYGYRDFVRKAYLDGKLSAQLRQNVGLGLS